MNDPGKVTAMISNCKKVGNFTLLATTLTIAALLITVAPAYTQKVRASYGGFNTSSNIPPWVAYDAGLFKHNGLDVELIFASSSLMMPAVLNKDILLADANAFGLIKHRARGGGLSDDRSEIRQDGGGALCYRSD
jgi:ABC-type nitrate/sulfonate/bicarbonate transport system substrate-binding protein